MFIISFIFGSNNFTYTDFAFVRDDIKAAEADLARLGQQLQEEKNQSAQMRNQLMRVQTELKAAIDERNATVQMLDSTGRVAFRIFVNLLKANDKPSTDDNVRVELKDGQLYVSDNYDQLPAGDKPQNIFVLARDLNSPFFQPINLGGVVKRTEFEKFVDLLDSIVDGTIDPSKISTTVRLQALLTMQPVVPPLRL